MKVLYIMSWGRSGSTLLDNLLGEVPGFFSAGELHRLWERGLLQNSRCGCGLEVSRCPVWKEVVHRVGVDAQRSGFVPEPRTIANYRADTLRVRNTRRLLRLARQTDLDHDLAWYVTTVSSLYRNVAEVTGATVIVDSTKSPADAAILRAVSGVEPFFIHLVRDPRAVAHSWQRERLLTDLSQPRPMVRHPPAGSTMSWLAWNLGAESVRRAYPAGTSMLVRYEDFVSEPKSTIQEIIGLLDEPDRELSFLQGFTAKLEVNHTVSGNPSRYAVGSVELRADTEWTRELPSRDRALATAIALPLLRRYGYSVRGHGIS